MMKTIVITVIGLAIAGGVYFFTQDLNKEEVSQTEALQTEQPGEPPAEPVEAIAEGVKVGDQAPDFSAPTPDGDELSLNDVLAKKGKVTIVEFWASWCPYCQAEMPNVSKIYKKYHDQGLEIMSVSIDAKRKDWLKAIDKYDMNWSHVSHLMEWEDPIIEQYGVESIPSNFILDAEGKVVAKDLTAEDLDQKIAELLGA